MNEFSDIHAKGWDQWDRRRRQWNHGHSRLCIVGLKVVSYWKWREKWHRWRLSGKADKDRVQHVAQDLSNWWRETLNTHYSSISSIWSESLPCRFMLQRQVIVGCGYLSNKKLFYIIGANHPLESGRFSFWGSRDAPFVSAHKSFSIVASGNRGWMYIHTYKHTYIDWHGRLLHNAPKASYSGSSYNLNVLSLLGCETVWKSLRTNPNSSVTLSSSSATSFA